MSTPRETGIDGRRYVLLLYLTHPPEAVPRFGQVVERLLIERWLLPAPPNRAELSRRYLLRVRRHFAFEDKLATFDPGMTHYQSDIVLVEPPPTAAMPLHRVDARQFPEPLSQRWFPVPWRVTNASIHVRAPSPS